MARTVIRVSPRPGAPNVAVRLPKGSQSLSPKLAAAIDDMMGRQRLSSNEGCMVAFFHKRGKLIAAQRCDSRKLATGAKARWNKMKGKKVCRGKQGKAKGKFIACR